MSSIVCRKEAEYSPRTCSVWSAKWHTKIYCELLLLHLVKFWFCNGIKPIHIAMTQIQVTLRGYNSTVMLYSHNKLPMYVNKSVMCNKVN